MPRAHGRARRQYPRFQLPSRPSCRAGSQSSDAGSRRCAGPIHCIPSNRVNKQFHARLLPSFAIPYRSGAEVVQRKWHMPLECRAWPRPGGTAHVLDRPLARQPQAASRNRRANARTNTGQRKFGNTGTGAIVLLCTGSSGARESSGRADLPLMLSGGVGLPAHAPLSAVGVRCLLPLRTGRHLPYSGRRATCARTPCPRACCLCLQHGTAATGHLLRAGARFDVVPVLAVALLQLAAPPISTSSIPTVARTYIHNGAAAPSC